MVDSNGNIEIFDRRRRRTVRDRAMSRTGGEDFLSKVMVGEILERLSLVKRSFSNGLIIGLPADGLRQELERRGISTTVADPCFRVPSSSKGVQCDEDFLPFEDHSFDLVINTGTLDTVNDLPGALALTRRILVPDGLFLASFIGAESLPVLKSLLMEAEGDKVAAHIHPQIDVRTIGDLMSRIGFALPVVDSDRLQLRYSEFSKLLKDIRDIGGSNSLRNHCSSVSRVIYEEVARKFQDRSDETGKTTELVELVHISGWAPHPDQPAPAKRGSGQVSLKKILGKRTDS